MHVNQRATCIFFVKNIRFENFAIRENHEKKKLVTINDNKTSPSFYTYLFVNIYIYIYVCYTYIHPRLR